MHPWSIPAHVFSLCVYFFVWLAFYQITAKVKRNKSLALSFLSLIFYGVFCSSFILVLLIEQLQGQLTISFLQNEYLIATVAFYLFSSIKEFQCFGWKKWSLYLHHIAFGTIIWFGVVPYTSLPSVYLWVIATQVSSVFTSLKRLLWHYPPVYRLYKRRIEELDYWFFLLSRIIFQTLIMLYFLVDIYDRYSTASLFTLSITLGGIMSLYLNLYWFEQIVQRRRKQRNSIQIV